MNKLFTTPLLVFSAIACFAQTFTSTESGNWNDGATWGNTCAPCFAGTDYPSGSDSVFINAAHVVTIPDGLTVIRDAGSIITNDGIIDIQNTALLDVAGIIVNNEGGSFNNDWSTRVIFQSTGIYRHNYTVSPGSIIRANWLPGSTCEIIGYTENTVPPDNLWQSFHHFTWNCSSYTAAPVFSLDGLLATVQGNFTITSAGPGDNALVVFGEAEGYLLEVFGDIIVNGNGRVVFSTAGGYNEILATNFRMQNTIPSPLPTVVLTETGAGNGLTLTGALALEASVAASFSVVQDAGGQGSIYVNGDVDIQSSNILTSVSSGGMARVRFEGEDPRTFTSNGTVSGRLNFQNPGAVLTLGSSSSIGGAGSTFVNENSGTLIMGNFFLSEGGPSTFTNYGRLVVSLSDPFSNITGNIRITTRTYGGSADIVMAGSSPQTISASFPAPAGGVSVTIANTEGVSLTANLTIATGRRLTIESNSSLSIGSSTLVLNGLLSGTGPLIGGAAANLTIGGSNNLDDTGNPEANHLTFASPFTLNNVTLNRTSGTVTLGSDLTVLGTFTHSAGNLILNGRTLQINGYSRTGGTLGISNTSSLIVAGSAATLNPFVFNGTELHTLTVDHTSPVGTSANLTLSTLNLTSGTFANGGTITMAPDGTIHRTNAGSMNNAPEASSSSSYNVVYTAGSDMNTGPELPAGATALGSLTKNGSAMLTLASPVTINGTLTLNNGTFSSGTQPVVIRGNVINNATAMLSSSDVTFSGTTILSGATEIAFGNMIVSGTLTPAEDFNYRVSGNISNAGTIHAGTGESTTTFDGTTTLSGEGSTSFHHVVIGASHSLISASSAINVSGTFTNNGTFDHANGTVVFNGASSVEGSELTSFFHVTISGTLTAPEELRLVGDFTNNGTFVRGTGNVIFNGSVTQRIQGSSRTEFNDITIANTEGSPAVQVLSAQDLFGTLTLSSGTIFDPDGTTGDVIFRLRSTGDSPANDARVAELPTNAVVDGLVTVQRFMSIEPGPNGNNRIYRNISSPVHNAPVSQIQTFIPVSGTFTGQNHTGAQSMFAYDETVTTGDLNNGYVDFPATANTEMLQTARGYNIFIRGNQAPITTAGSALWEVRGRIHAANSVGGSPGTISFPTTFTSSGNVDNDGWNLVGNPFPSTIDWNAPDGWTKGGDLTGTIYMRDNGGPSSRYATWNGVIGTNNGSRYIPTGQAFWVKATGSYATLTADERVKVSDAESTFFRTATPDNFLRITLRKGNLADETVIHFRADATDAYNPAKDAIKLNNSTLNLATSSTEGLRMAINSMSKIECGKVIPLLISEITSDTHTLEFSEFESFPENVNIELTDVLENKVINVREERSYTFAINATQPNTFGNERFYITVSYHPPVATAVYVPEIICPTDDGSVTILNSSADMWYTILQDTDIIAEQISGTNNELIISVAKDRLRPGANAFTVKTSAKECVNLQAATPFVLNIEAPFQLSVNDAMRCNEGTVVLTASGAADGKYRWYETENAETPIAGQFTSKYETPNLTKGKTYFVTGVSSTGCESTRKPVRAQVVYAEPVVSVQSASSCEPGALILSASGGSEGSEYHWYESSDATAVTFFSMQSSFETPVLQESATYFVSIVNEQGCESDRVPVHAEIKRPEQVVITVDGLKLTSSYAEGNEWYINDVLIGNTTAEVTASQSGEYKVVVQAGNCSTEDSVHVALPYDGPTTLQAYPNPAGESVTVSVASEYPVNYTLFNASSVRVADGNLSDMGNGIYAATISVKHLQAGTYYLHVSSRTMTSKQKIIKK